MTTNRRTTDKVIHTSMAGKLAGAPVGSGAAMGVLSSMFAGLFFWGGVGWLLDQWWGTRFVIAIGAVVGLALSVYVVVVKYGRADLSVPPLNLSTIDTGVSDSSTRKESE